MSQILASVDPVAAQWLRKEERRQESSFSLIASENYASQAVLAAGGTVLTNKYAEGYPGRRYYGGCEVVDEVESLAIERAKTLFGVEAANVQPHSGSQANMAVYSRLLDAGDTILGMAMDAGGHLTHGAKVSASGRLYQGVHYGVDANGHIDYDEVHRLAQTHQPKLIVAGFSAYSGMLDWAEFRRIADDVGAYLLADIAHIAGLVATDLYPSPVPYADVITTTTHKTLRGPRGGMILIPRGQDLAKKCNFGVFPATQGGPAMHMILGKAVAFGEALTPAFKTYQTQVLAHAKRMVAVLQARGLKIVSGGTDNHLFMIDLIDQPHSGALYEQQLAQVGLIVNKNNVPGDPRPPMETSGLRIGTPAITTRGLEDACVASLATWIADVIEAPFDPARLARIRRSVTAMCEAHPIYPELSIEGH